jgi:hypothetical protein
MNRCIFFLFVSVMAILALVVNPVPMQLAAQTKEALNQSIYLPLILKSPQGPPPGVQVLSNYSYYVDSSNHLHVVGEISNNTSNNLQLIKITANFFNGSGQLLLTDFSYTYLEDLPAYDKTCFDVSVPVPNGWSYFEFEQPSYYTDGTPLTSLILLNVSGSYDALLGWYKIIGQVRNDYGNQVKYVRPVATLYNASGTVIGCNLTFVDGTHLGPNQTSSFTIYNTGRDYKDVSTYKVQVSGW